jgi:hypothetical protein
MTQKSEVILVVKIVEVKSPPSFWSGVMPAIQQVRYKVLRTIKGSTPHNEITVRHFVVRNSLTADRTSPRLSPRLFAPGSRLLLFLRRSREPKRDASPEYYILDENYGALRTNSRLEKKVEKYSSAK